MSRLQVTQSLIVTLVTNQVPFTHPGELVKDWDEAGIQFDMQVDDGLGPPALDGHDIMRFSSLNLLIKTTKVHLLLAVPDVGLHDRGGEDMEHVSSQR